MFESFFTPSRFMRRFESYQYFAHLPTKKLIPLLDSIYEAEEEHVSRDAFHVNLKETLELCSFAVAESLQERALSSMESRRFWFLDFVLWGLKISDDQFLLKYLAIEGLEAVEAAISEYGSCVFVLPHLGPHRIAAFVLARLGVRVAITGGYDDVDTMAGIRMAEFHGLHLLDESAALTAGPMFKQRMVERLLEGRSTLLYPEYSLSENLGSLTTTFLGQRVHVPTGAARLGAGTGRPMIFVALIPEGDHRYRLVFDPPVPPSALQTQSAIEQAMTSVFQRVEALVRASPAAWEGWRTFLRMIQNGATILRRSAQA
jgi:lauroyl/myristoyl acyltransferase